MTSYTKISEGYIETSLHIILVSRINWFMSYTEWNVGCRVMKNYQTYLASYMRKNLVVRNYCFQPISNTRPWVVQVLTQEILTSLSCRRASYCSFSLHTSSLCRSPYRRNASCHHMGSSMGALKQIEQAIVSG